MERRSDASGKSKKGFNTMSMAGRWEGGLCEQPTFNTKIIFFLDKKIKNKKEQNEQHMTKNESYNWNKLGE